MPETITNSIIHKGFIERINDQSVIVKIISESACAACHAKGACTAADMQDKEIEVRGVFSEYISGELVELVMEQSQGFKALALGYIYPFAILLSVLLIASSAGFSELICGLLALGFLFPYYYLLYLFRKKIRKGFNFSIRKIS